MRIQHGRWVRFLVSSGFAGGLAACGGGGGGGVDAAALAALAAAQAQVAAQSAPPRTPTPTAAPTFKDACAALVGVAIPNGKISTAMFTPAAIHPTDASQSVPDHCLVAGVMNERTGVDGKAYALQFQLRLPVDWNKRFFYQGGGGVDGSTVAALGTYPGGGNTRNALLDGAAVVTTDSGHQAPFDLSSNATFLFAADPQARDEYGDAQLPLVANSAKATIARLYGAAPEKSYFAGCSNGGRQALVAAQRHPELFDGIIGVAPGFRLAEAALEGSIFRAQLAATVAPVGADGKPDILNPLTAAEKLTVKNRILAACDALDGAQDGMVSRVSACRPDPMQWVCTGGNTSNCLSPAKATYVQKFFAGAKTSTGEQIYGPWPYDPGMVDVLGTPAYLYYWIFAGEASHVYTTPPTITSDLIGYSLTADLDAEYAKIFAISGIYTRSGKDFTDADSPNMDAFRARKGKLLMLNGTADWAFSAKDLESYYKKVQTRYGANGAADFARLFFVPGMDHCSGGKQGTDQFDAYGALVKWVEQGAAPDTMISTARADAGVAWPGRTRPLCSYPKEAVYTGSGSIEAASSFRCE